MLADHLGGHLPSFIWMGTSIESAEFTSRLNDLRRVSCMTHFVSFEPLLGSVGKLDLSRIDWAIIDGESGPRHRPVKKEWILDIIRECRKHGVAVFFKQWGDKAKDRRRDDKWQDLWRVSQGPRQKPVQGSRSRRIGYRLSCPTQTSGKTYRVTVGAPKLAVCLWLGPSWILTGLWLTAPLNICEYDVFRNVRVCCNSGDINARGREAPHVYVL